MRATIYGLLIGSWLVACKQPSNNTRQSSPKPAAEGEGSSVGPPTGHSIEVMGEVTPKSKPDKVSEVPTGLPGYPLVCQWQNAPSREMTEAKLACFVADESGKAAPGLRDVSWSLRNSHDEVGILEEAQSNGQLVVTLSRQPRDILLSAAVDLQLSVRASAFEEKKALGRDLLKANPQAQKVAANCGPTLFSLMLSDDTSRFTFSELSRFNGCETLTAALQNRSFPDPAVRSLPATATTVMASCSDRLLEIRIVQPALSGQLAHSTVTAEICQDLATFINAQGL